MQRIFLIRNVPRDAYGGGESYQLELAKILQANNFDPIIVSSSKELLKNASRQKIKSIKALYLKNQNWSSWRNLLLPIYFFWQIRLYFWYKKQIKKYKPVALDIQSRDDWIAATLAGKKLKTKIFWTDHIDFRTWVLQNINQKFKNPIGKYILKLATIPQKIIMISDFERKIFEKNIKPQKLDNIITIKNGVKDKLYQYKTAKSSSQSFCYVGRIIDYKGINELIKAFELISPDFPTAKLNIFGTGPEEEKYRNLAQNPNIIFHGYTKEPLKAIAESEIFILPSYYEGLSISLLQATMMQKTIIATDIDGNPEVVEDEKTGLLVPAKNSQKLANAMRKVLEDPKLAEELAKNARQKYKKEFNFEDTVKEKFIPLI